MIDFHAARDRLGLLWLSFFVLLFLLFVLQTFGQRFGSREEQAWAWFLPSILPTVSLILAVYAREAFDRRSRRRIRKGPFYIAFAVSLLYLLILAAVIVVPAFWGRPFFEFIGATAYFLGPLQGLAAGILGVFFAQATGGDGKEKPATG